MKQLSLYMCEFCHTQYKDKQECKKCEESHVMPKQINGTKFLPWKNNKAGYPQKISILFEDGKVVEYER